MLPLGPGASSPRPVVALACGSRSTSSVRKPSSASAAPRLMAVVVLPTPPFWFATAITRATDASTPALPLAHRGRMRKPAAGGEAEEASPLAAWKDVVVYVREHEPGRLGRGGDALEIGARGLHREHLPARGDEAGAEGEKCVDPERAGDYRGGAHPHRFGPSLEHCGSGEPERAHDFAEKAGAPAPRFDQDDGSLGAQAGEDDSGKPRPAAHVGKEAARGEVHGRCERVDHVLAHDCSHVPLAGEPGRA